MKKTLLIIAVSIFIFQFPNSQAQSYKTVGDNTWFLSLGGGGVLYKHSGEGQFSVPTATVNLGCWITRPLAFRFGFDMMMTPSHYQNGGTENSMYFMGSAEFLWDVNATFFNVYNGTLQKPIPVYPMLGVGMVMRPSVTAAGVTHEGDNDFQAMLGLHFPVRFASLWDAFFEYKWFFLSQHFDGSANNNFMHSFTVGVTHRWGDNPYSRKTEFASRNTAEDWWVGFGIGPNFSSFKFRNIGEWGMYGITPEIQFGRNYSNVWTIRFELGGLTAHEPYDTVEGCAGAQYKYTNLHTDVMVNLTHAVDYTRGVRLNVLPYLGAGLIWRYDEPTFNLTADFGVMLRYYVSYHSDIYVDFKYMMVPPTIAGIQPEAGEELSKSYLDWGALPSITLGYIYNFGSSSTRYRYPVGQ